METLILTRLFPEEIAEALNLEPYRGRQIFRWLHKKRVFDVENMTDLSKELRNQIAEKCVLVQSQIAHIRESFLSDTKKILLKYRDGQFVECVVITHRNRVTFCISTQVGCPLGCAFCATGKVGFKRNLNAGEIVEQVLHLLSFVDLGKKNPNIVYMGMGEPFWNYDEVTRSIKLLMHQLGVNIGARRITVSTAGDVKGIMKFADEDWQVRLSVSLHSADDNLRSRLVPLNRKYPLNKLAEALHYYQEKTNRMFTFEYVLLSGVNDSLEDADALLQYAKQFKCNVNIIPWNPVAGLNFQPPSKEACEKFQNYLTQGGLNATMRREHGQDIEAACGQLRRIFLDSTQNCNHHQ
ncbi:MAG: 23S rRNA (adenine(2503)-C(2))-methyltransferase RlmN [Candidatus Hydrogenedentes bacterium]|nr:23S rRNA (adenine(2503)-C(2))-methyltransferase RlmN [Candidatus Hydrogenedentota bacterium]